MLCGDDVSVQTASASGQELCPSPCVGEIFLNFGASRSLYKYSLVGEDSVIKNKYIVVQFNETDQV